MAIKNCHSEAVAEESRVRFAIRGTFRLLTQDDSPLSILNFDMSFCILIFNI